MKTPKTTNGSNQLSTEVCHDSELDLRTGKCISHLCKQTEPKHKTLMMIIVCDIGMQPLVIFLLRSWCVNTLVTYNSRSLVDVCFQNEKSLFLCADPVMVMVGGGGEQLTLSLLFQSHAVFSKGKTPCPSEGYIFRGLAGKISACYVEGQKVPGSWICP